MANFYDKDYVPHSVEELYESGWKEYMLYHIRRYTLHDVNHSPEDLLHDMMCQLIKTGYLDKYDPEQGEFTLYLYSFIRNFMSKPYNREHKTQNGANIVNSASLVSSVSDASDNSDGSQISYETIAGEGNFTDYLCLVQALETDLKAIKTESQVEYDGEILKRDPFTVYKMLRSGYSIKEIADKFGTSQQFVYSLRKKILGIIESYA